MDSIIPEQELIFLLEKSKNVLLIEPLYRRSYIPLGLAKISSFIKSHGGNVTYSRDIVSGNFDLICIATMFTNDSEIVIKTIKKCKSDMFLKNAKIVIGGIFASMMPEYIYDNTGEKVFTGYSKTLDSYLPDYEMDYGVPGFFNDTMTLFTTRGCVNKCAYCMVWRMEKEYYICPNWERNIENINREICVVSDNSFLSAPPEHVEDVIDSLNKNNKKVIFNNGMNCREINDKNAKQLASLKYIKNGFRIGFDRIKDDGHYQEAMARMQKAGLKIQGNSYTYVLYNFKETPQDSYYRAQEAWKFKSNPYLMRYRPLNQVTKKLDYVGKYWTKNLVKAFSYYGSTFGYNRGDKTFEGWMKSSDIKLTSEDWDKWNYKKDTKGI
jgi:hypothetical protein